MTKQPVLFVSHGSPLMAIKKSKTSQFLQKLGKSLTKPDAIIVFSAHFDLPEDIVITAGERPPTIHDFYGFPEALYHIQYKAPGAPLLAKQIAQRFTQAGLKPILDDQQGWDHGLWIPLRLMFPDADIPIVQISINSRLGARRNYDYGKLIAPYNEQNILIIGSGNVSHNLREMFSPSPTRDGEKKVRIFTDWVADKLVNHDTRGLLNYLEEAPYVLFNHPTQEHFLPLIAALGSNDSGDVQVIHQDIEGGVLAMDAYRFG